ncbi:MAG TPA: DoxX family protein [Opitutaceae bacterium]
MIKLLRLEFIPSATDFALLILRVCLGGTMVFAHGWPKLMKLVQGNVQFSDPLGLVGPMPALAIAVIGEAICAVLIVLGAFTRIAAAWLGVIMGVAFFVVHNAKLVGQGNGELAFVYFVGCIVLFLTGAGRFSVDGKSGGGGSGKVKPVKSSSKE